MIKKAQRSKSKDQNKTKDRKQKIKSVILFLGFWICFGFSAYAGVVSANELVNQASKYDGQLVEFVGEVVGDIMPRKGFAWLNVSDGSHAIGIWSHNNKLKELKIAGNYKHVGDKIKVVGVFHRACKQHGGDLDLHAKQITLISKGFVKKHPINYSKLIIAITLLLLTIVLFFAPKYAIQK